MTTREMVALARRKVFLNINGWHYESVGWAELIKVALDIARGAMSQK